MLLPTPTETGIPFRGADFPSLPDALDYAAGGNSGITIYSGRGKIVEVLPYRDLRAEALALARRMAAAGLNPGDRVAVIAETDGDFIKLFFACQYAGLVPAPMPLPMAFGGRAAYLDHIRRMIESADASAAFAPAALEAWLQEAVEGLDLVLSGCVSALDAVEPASGPLPETAGEALAYLQFSSGSTRFPVGVAVTQKAAMSNISAIVRDGLQVAPGDRCVSWLPYYHDMGLVGFLLTPVAAQMSLDLLPTREFARRPLMWPELISRNRATLSFSPSFGYDLCVRRMEHLRAGNGGGPEQADTLDLTSWRVAGIGGDMIRPKTLERFARAFAPQGFRNTAFVPSYGMAETTLAISFAPLGRGVKVDCLDMNRLETDGAAVAASAATRRAREFARCGRVLEGHEMEVRGEGGARLPDRRIGRIFVRGPSLMQAYYRQPLATQAVLGSGGWLDTGDIGYMERGEVVITGRAKDLILVNGRNIAPHDLEWTVEHEIGELRSGDAAAFSVDGEEGERVVVLVQCRTADGERRERLKANVQAILRKAHGVDCEAVLTPHNSLPHTSSGKLSRNRARQLYLERAFAESPGAAADAEAVSGTRAAGAA